VRALLDEQLSLEIAVELRARGHDVEAVGERPDLVGGQDRDIIAVAYSEGRAVITNNLKDFRPLAAARSAQGEQHGGLILLPSTRARTRAQVLRLADAIATVLSANPDGLESSERWVGPLERR
jgi:hypothetical protein